MKSLFRQWLYDNGYLQKDFCEAISVERTSLYKWMKGIKRPNVVSMRRIRAFTKGRFSKPEDLLDRNKAAEVNV